MKTVTVAEYKEMLKAQGVPFEKVTHKCPHCETLQSAEDLVAVGAGKDVDDVEKYLGFSCIGRWTKHKGCDWTLGGLFQIHQLEVVTADGVKHPRFMPMTAAELEAEKAARPPAELAELNESDLKKVTASAHLEIDVECPHCEESFDCLDDDSIKEVLGPNLRAEGIEVELECPHCKKPFLVTEITY